MYKNITGLTLRYISACEIRLYSYVPLGYPSNNVAHTFLSSAPSTVCAVNSQYPNPLKLQSTSGLIDTSCTGSPRGYKLLAATDVYFEIRFTETRFVHSVTLVLGFITSYSRYWVLTLGNNTGAAIKNNPEIARY
jgi:hypothetical protein